MKTGLVLVAVLALLWILYKQRLSLQQAIAITVLRVKNTIPYSYKVENKGVIKDAWYTQKIPLKLHQTSFSRNVDYSLAKSCSLNHNINPEYEYYFYDDKEVADYINTNFPQYIKHYNSVKPGAFKADLFRLLVLYREGGVYLDCKSYTVTPLRDILRKEDELYMTQDIIKGCIYQGFIASTPGHELVKKFIDKYISNIESKYYGINTLDIGGPQMIGRVFNLHYGKNELGSIESFDRDGVRIGATVKLINSSLEVLMSIDKKELYCERANSDYYKNKLKSMLSGKDYGVAWAMGKVYE